LKDHIRDILDDVQAEYAEIRLEKAQDTRIVYTGPELEDCSQNVNFGGNVRVLYKGAWGFTTFNSIDELQEKCRLATSHAKSLGDRLHKPFKLAEVPILDVEIPLDVKKNPLNIPLSEKIEIMNNYNRIILDFDERITTSSVFYFDRQRKVTFANSEGTYISRESVDLAFASAAIVNNQEGSHFGYYSQGSSNDFDVVLNREKDIRKVCNGTIETSQASVVNAGKYTVILDPHLAGVFIHEAFGHLSEADILYEDPNLKKVMVLGRQFGVPDLNVADSGHEIGNRGYLPYDDEGVATQKTYLIKDGKLVGRLHSRETASKMNEKPTGNARAITFAFPPIPRMRTTMIEPGKVSFNDMVSQTKNGLYCISARGGETNGELFTFTAMEAFMIRDGKIAEKVRDVTLSGNVFDTLKNIDMIGNDYLAEDGPGGCGKRGQMPLPTSEGSPHIRIQNVVVGGK
jgi:TldD protein